MSNFDKEFADAFAEAVGEEKVTFDAPAIVENDDEDGQEVVAQADATADQADENADESDGNGEEVKPATQSLTQEEKDKVDEAEEKKAEMPIEELQKRLAELQHRERSSSGRVGAFQKRINALERQLAESQQKMLAALKSDDPKFREDFPEIAAAMDRKVAMVAQSLQEQTKARLQPIHEVERERFVQTQYAALDAAYPGWKQAVQSDNFRNWLTVQPEQVQSLARSDSAADAAALIQFFTATSQAQRPAAPQPAQPQNPVTAQRKAALAQAAGIQSRSKPAATQSIPSDFESAFDAFVKADSRLR